VVCSALTLCRTPVSARDLSFDDRIKAQEAIERVYYSHQIGATRPFEEAVPREVLERKVRTYLKQSEALQTIWGRPVTSEALRQETGRMAAQSRMPARLHEIFSALGDDTFLIDECLSRATLVDRLARDYFSSDRIIHGRERRRAEELRRGLASGAIDPWSEHPDRIVIDAVRQGSDERVSGSGEIAGRINDDETPMPGGRQQAHRVPMSPEAFDRLSEEAPGSTGEIGPLLEKPDKFVIRTVLDRRPGSVLLANFVVRKLSWDEWWTQVEAGLDPSSVETVGREGDPPPLPDRVDPTSPAPLCTPDTWDNGIFGGAPEELTGHTAVWTGTQMIVWGSRGGQNKGYRYDPASDVWTTMTSASAPSPRTGHSAVWTGRFMIVWGGTVGSQTLRTGGRYDPVANTWTATSLVNAPSSRFGHTAVWAENVMVVWGGSSFYLSYGSLNTGGRYDPVADSWAPTSLVGAPLGRRQHAAVWTGHDMIVWGGIAIDPPYTSMFNSGSRYDPATDVWLPTSLVNAPSPRLDHVAVWTGRVMVVWGGRNGPDRYVTGGTYDPAVDRWTATTTENAPPPGGLGVWTGQQMLVWGGTGGGRYDPAANAWTRISSQNAPPGGGTAIWTGSLFVVWGGAGNRGGRYDPSSDSWASTITRGPLGPRAAHTAIWTGSLMVVWGGHDGSSDLRSGGRYDPATDTLRPTSETGAPSARESHTAVWTGDRMVVWGGYGGGSTGGRYDPVADTWLPTSTTNAPSARFVHTAVWTGALMVIWGGFGSYSQPYLNSGGRYDPAADRWEPTSTVNEPSGRFYHSAVWTGSRMVVWGGSGNTGGRYDPLTDTWEPTSRVNAPSGRYGHSAVWTGRTMVVWGGGSYYDNLDTGGRYDPVADLWTPTSTAGSPGGRDSHSAVWTGNFLVVWGGIYHNGDVLEVVNSGGRYDPVADTWAPMSLLDAPSARSGQSVVWTGSEMIIWGGGYVLNDGGRYCPCQSRTFFRDSDGDGYGSSLGSLRSCGQPEGHVTTGDDCDDSDPSVHPGALETCNGADDNCDGALDEGFGVGRDCAERIDDCHRLTGTEACRPDGTGTECRGVISPHDVTPPSISCPADVTLECPASSDGLGVPRVEDVCDPDPAVSNDSPSVLPLGTSTITWTAMDESGNISTCRQPVAQVDTAPPKISIGLVPPALWPPNHRMVEVVVAPDVSDACDAQQGRTPTVILSMALSSEPDDARGGSDGDTTGDIQDAEVGTADFQIRLRAERDGNGSGRTYILTYSATDGSGTPASASASVFVPHDQRGTTDPLMISVAEGVTGTFLDWDEVPGALSYSVVRGDVSNLRETGAAIELGPVTCARIEAATPIAAGYEDRSTPAAGEASFYLVAYDDGLGSSGYGTASISKPRVASSGDCP
jgi:N-acetylneuraminic acid mutarotase